MKKTIKKYKWLIIWAIISLLFLIIIHILFHIRGPKWLQAKWTAGEILTYVSTVSLGLLAFWQNQKFQEEQYKKDDYHLAIEKYALFDFEKLDVEFIDSKTNTSSESGKVIESGFNGNKAVWKYGSYALRDIDKIKLQFQIKNIGNVPATNLFVADQKGEKIDETNVLSSSSDINDKKYILCNDNGILIINCDINSLKSPQEYYLMFTSPFGSRYSQKITIFATAPTYKIIQIDAQCQLTVMEEI